MSGLLETVIKLKGDILADAELPLVLCEIEGLLGKGWTTVRLSGCLFPQELRENPEFPELLTRKCYKGSVQGFRGFASVAQIGAVRQCSAYVSDVFAWALGPGSEEGLNRLLGTLGAGLNRGGGMLAGPGFNIQRVTSGWLAHIVPVYWYLEYAAHALGCCPSPRHARWAAEHLLGCPFSLKRDRLSTKVFGEQSYTTAHFTHGLHQYKGKFFPRMVRALLNAHRPDCVLDPFCGSGTLQAEASTAGYTSTGFDLNPLAVNICRMKEELLAVDPDEFDSYYQTIAPYVRTARVRQPSLPCDNELAFTDPGFGFPHDLEARLSPRDVHFTRAVRAAIEKNPLKPCSHAFLMILSDALKSKVRVRVGGKTAFFYAIEPNQSDFPTRFRERLTEVSTFVHFWKELKKLLQLELAPARTIEGDARSWPHLACSPDLIITSPPYFPYTGISYVYTNLAAVAVLGIKNLRALEEQMIGNTLSPKPISVDGLGEIREIASLYSFLEADKYRKDRIPVYAKYFRDISLVFRQMKLHCAPDAEVRFVVAKSQKLYRMRENRTLHEVDCVGITRTLAERQGLAYIGQTEIPLFKSDKVSLFPSNEGIEVVLHFKV